jgi:hypothetical protein
MFHLASGKDYMAIPEIQYMEPPPDNDTWWQGSITHFDFEKIFRAQADKAYQMGKEGKVVEAAPEDQGPSEVLPWHEEHPPFVYFFTRDFEESLVNGEHLPFLTPFSAHNAQVKTLIVTLMGT